MNKNGLFRLLLFLDRSIHQLWDAGRNNLLFGIRFVIRNSG